jgi:hypothetical protein
MIRSAATLLLALSGCASAPVQPVAPESVPAEVVTAPVLVCPAPPRLSRCGPPPAAPKIEWVPAGCPPQYGACLSPLDSVGLAAYLQASRQWMARCSDAR